MSGKFDLVVDGAGTAGGALSGSARPVRSRPPGSPFSIG
jgi:hypothetical protein